MEVFGVEFGLVMFFVLINDRSVQWVIFVFDVVMMELDVLNYYLLKNDVIMVIKVVDLIKFVKVCGYELRIFVVSVQVQVVDV